MYRLGLLWTGDCDHEEDPEKAVRWLKAAAEGGFPPAYPELAEALLCGYGGRTDPESAFRWFKAASDCGDPVSMFHTGYMLSEGLGCGKDEASAAEYFRSSAEGGVPEAMLKMAGLCSEGAVPGGASAAYNWCRAAADTGFVPAVYRQATMLYQGDGVQRNLEAAYSLYRGLADAGEADAMFMVGRMKLDGFGVEKDEEDGLRWIEKASKSGSSMAMQLMEDIRRRQNTQLIRIDGRCGPRRKMGPKPRLRSVFGIGSLVDRDVDGIASASLPAGAGSSATAACYAVPSVPADRVYRTEDHQYYRGSDDEIADHHIFTSSPASYWSLPLSWWNGSLAQSM